jgi:hypothetical protein
VKSIFHTAVTAVVTAVVLSWSGARAADHRPTADEEALITLERNWVDAENRHDGAALQAILDDRFVATFGAGKLLNKDAFIQHETRGTVDPTISQGISDRTIIVVADTAVVVETFTVHKTKDGLSTSAAWRFTVTYVRQGDHWVALAEQGDAIKM